jgi:uncharacterized protein (TIGR02996 family)
MRDEAGFLAAIQAAPGDDTTRLVYADWLDEQGRPGSEFLRLEYQLSALAPGDRDQRDLLLARLRLTSRGLDLDWMAFVSRVPLGALRLHWTSGESGSEPVQARERAYLDILHHGLVRVRDFAYAGQTQLCEIEADHLHNIPTLLGETNESRHVFYIMQERGLYLERLRRLGATEYLELVTIWYSEPWWVLACAAGVTQSE